MRAVIILYPPVRATGDTDLPSSAKVAIGKALLQAGVEVDKVSMVELNEKEVSQSLISKTVQLTEAKTEQKENEAINHALTYLLGKYPTAAKSETIAQILKDLTAGNDKSLIRNAVSILANAKESEKTKHYGRIAEKRAFEIADLLFRYNLV